MRLSEKLKALRKAKNYTQSDLAKYSGVSLGSIKRYETEDCNITHDTLLKLAKSLGSNDLLELSVSCPLVNDKMSDSQNGNLSDSHQRMSDSAKNDPLTLNDLSVSQKSFNYDALFALIRDFAPPRLLLKWQNQLLEIKRLSEEE